jgi:galactose mutarotase-like enzyme
MSVTIAARELEATFLPDVGMLGTSLRFRGEDLVALPAGVSGYREGNETGLPLLAPWANRLDGWRYRAAGVDVDLGGLALPTDEHGLPIHGTMTAAVGWEVVEHEDARLWARFQYGARPDLLAAFPFPHDLEIDARVDGEALRIATTVRPTSDRPVPVAVGWHPYLRLPGGDRASWRLRLPPREHLELDSRGIPTGASKSEEAESAPIGERTFDDLYALGDEHEIGLEHGDWRLTVRYEAGYPYAQVFAPPGADFACVEPMIAPTNALSTGACPLVAPGQSFTARFSIGVA